MDYSFISKKIVKQLKTPKPNSHKRDNGRLLIIAGSNKYFGALVYAVKTASRIVDLVYLLSTPENQQLIKKLKLGTAEFMPISKFPDTKILADIDAILIGPGLGISANTKKLTSQVLKSGKKAVLDADALNVLDNNLKRLLSTKHILTPHHKEFYRLFKISPSPKNASKMAKKYHCTIVLKGPIDIIASPGGKISLNKTGNAGMTKGGTGDVLAGLIAGLYTTNNAFTSAATGTYINGTAGDDLFKKVKTFYNAEDLAEQIPFILHKLVNRK
jgi:NAD(P)H-hydrate epimerase